MLFFLYLPCVYTADIIPSAKIAFPLLERQFQDSTDVRTQRYSTILNLKEGRKDRKEEGWVTEWGRYGVNTGDMSQLYGGMIPDYLDFNRFPEALTGYQGAHVWSAIHSKTIPVQNQTILHAGKKQQCVAVETILLDNIVSGLHTAVTLHTLNSPYLPRKKMMLRSKLNDRNVVFLENLYSLWAVIRQAMKSNTMKQYLDKELYQQMSRYPDAISVNTLYQGRNGAALKVDHQNRLYAILKDIWHINCDRCLSWAEIQLKGINTVYAILFEQPSTLSKEQWTTFVNLARQTVAAITILDSFIPQLSGPVRSLVTNSSAVLQPFRRWDVGSNRTMTTLADGKLLQAQTSSSSSSSLSATTYSFTLTLSALAAAMAIL